MDVFVRRDESLIVLLGLLFFEYGPEGAEPGAVAGSVRGAVCALHVLKGLSLEPHSHALSHSPTLHTAAIALQRACNAKPPPPSFSWTSFSLQVASC